MTASNESPVFHGTTILSVRRQTPQGVQVALGGDGQVTLGQVVMKADAKKVRKLYDGKVLASTARAIVSALQAYWNDVDGRVGGVKHRQTTLSEHWQSSQSSSLLSSVIQSKFEGEIYMHIGEYRILHGIK